MKRLLTSTAIVCGALCLGGALPAGAVTTTLTESWVMGTPDHTNCFKTVGSGSCTFEAPTLSTSLTSTSNDGLIDPMNSGSSQTVTIGVPTTSPTEYLFAAIPGNTNNTVSTADIPVTFTLSDGSGPTFGSVTFTAYMEYFADVKNQKDFMLWSASPFTSPSQTFINTGATLSLSETIAANGSVITMSLPYEQDWDMGQQVTFDVTVAPTLLQVGVPEPATISLLGLGLLGTAAVARRKRS